MIYIILTIVTIINIFNIGLIANNSLNQNKKEKMLLATYSLAEVIYILFLLTLIEYTAKNIVFILSFIIIWLLSKAYILTVNMNFDDNSEEVISMENDFEKEMDTNEEGVNEEIEVITEVPEEKVQVEDNNIEEDVKEEKIELSDLVENAKEKIFTPNSLHDLADIIESAKINKEEEIRRRRRSLALRASRIINTENNV